MHSNILQESTSLLKELNNLHRKANQGLRYPTTVKKPKTTTQMHTNTYNNISNINKNHKKQQSIGTNTTTGYNPSSTYTLLQERMNQLQSKLTAVKQLSNQTNENEQHTISSAKKKPSPRLTSLTYPIFYLV